MGIQDRTYYQDERRGFSLSGHSIVIQLILLNAAIYLADALSDGKVALALSLKSDLWSHPWQAWQLLTYGFVHELAISHVLFNMFGLWLFGSDVERIYGPAEFLRIYLTTIVLAGLAWAGITAVNGEGALLIGASGGVMGIMALYVFHFPKRMFYFWGIVPMPAWVLGVLYLGFDLMGATQPSGSHVANVAHLAGMAFGAIYFKTGMNLGRLLPSRLSTAIFRWRPKLKIHDPDQPPQDLNKQVDAILAKISQQGEASLTKQERRTLEEASRRYQRRRE